MRIADPYALRNKTPRDAVIFAYVQDTGSRPEQEDVCSFFQDECFILADGSSLYEHGRDAATLACDTAIWAYKHIRQHKYYWGDKKLFMKRIYRSTNLAVWQKQREKEFESGMATTLSVCMVGPKNYWLGNSGNSVSWRVQKGRLERLTPVQELFPGGKPKGLLGEKRLGLVPSYKSGPFAIGDVLVMASAGCASYLLPSDIEASVVLSGEHKESVSRAAYALIESAKRNGATDNMTAMIIKRVSLTTT